MDKDEKKIVICDLDGTVSDARNRAKNYLFEGYVCKRCGRRNLSKDSMTIGGLQRVSYCTKHEGLGTHCRGEMVHKEKDWDGFFSHVEEDNVMSRVMSFVIGLNQYDGKEGYKIVFVTARSEVCREQTEAWLLKNYMADDFELYMRATYDRRPAVKVKENILKNILGADDVAFAIEDEQEILDMYKENCQNAIIVDVRNYMWEEGS